MTGSLQVKKGFFYIVINTQDADGKRKMKWISTGLTVKGNKKQAEKMLREHLQKFESKAHLKKTDMLFSDAIRQWLAESAIRVDAVTLQGYETLCKGHILPYFDI